MSNDINLNTPFTLKNGTVIKNRLFKSAMSEQLGTKEHNPTKGLATLYKTWAEGGLGLSITGNIMVDRTALGEPKNVVLDTQSDLEPFKKWAQAGSANGSHIWPQLNHPGKQIPNFITEEPVAPSAIALENGLEKGFNKPRALTESEILDIIEKFATAAELSKKAGFTGVQIHGAHGYLVSQFLSPRHNQRNDQWGGSLENRMRFVLAVYHAMREKVGSDFPIGIKLNSADFMRGGFTEEDSMEVVKALASAGIDLIEISGGTYESPSMVGHKMKPTTQKREAYFLEYAEKVRNLIDTPLVVTGGFRSADGMITALRSGATDFIGLGRPLAVYPNLPNELMADENHSIELRPLTTGVKIVDKMAMLDITWYEFQLARMAQKKAPKPNMSEWSTFFKTLMGAGVYAFRKRRA
ncbi:NADH:flavin oxidoreductase/NADH oxidase family protein [Alkalimarinus sediminis]|uniref:NADH:flavin oxidoreductase/NADH oxidase family protein n=1 Tax=Alkalimarinus sediminis TaxID=1632866 RepID=A0A9E8HHL4_9ALTE|nr:NADH:flavin oxidoreductase/NADH oxidase family protein [Alkalimarinus sediminis]UZW74342.1 NADH:flavin oxidoreductase/NADH oxidase family protein [Alkalimarinus sediminis]